MTGTKLDKPKPHSSMVKYWENCKTDGRELKPIYGVVHLPGSTQPPGYIQAFDISLARAKEYQKRIHKDAKPNKPQTKIYLFKAEDGGFIV